MTILDVLGFFLMKNRAKLYSIFQKFYAEILTQFNISIRVLCSDNAREYFFAPFISFMSQHGILHQSFCAHTPQQNGVAERKNCYLTETQLVLSSSIIMFLFVFRGRCSYNLLFDQSYALICVT